MHAVVKAAALDIFSPAKEIAVFKAAVLYDEVPIEALSREVVVYVSADFAYQ